MVNKKFYIALIFAMITWGISWPSAKVLVRYSDPMTIAAMRMVWTVIGTFIIFRIARIPLKISKRGIWFVLLSGGLLGLYNILFFKGIHKGMPGAGGILVTTMTPIVAYLVAMMVNKRKNTARETVGLVLGLIAACIMLHIWDIVHELFKSGNLFFVAAVVVWVLLSRVNGKSSSYGHPLAFTWWMYAVCSLVLLSIVDVNNLVTVLQEGDTLFYINMVFNSVINAGMATTIFFVATTRLGVEKSSSFIYITPVSAAISSYLFLGEIIALHTIIGGAFALLAVMLLNSKKKVA